MIPSWNGFNIELINNIPIAKSNIGYHCIDSPAIMIFTIFEILDRCMKIKEKLMLSVVVCVSDQGISAKAVEIKWKYPESFQNCILMLGVFHMIMMYFGIIGKR